MVSVEDRPTNLGRVVVLPLPTLRSDLIRRPGEGLHFGKPMSVVCRPKPVEPSLSGRHSGRLEQCSIDQHAMHDHGELAGERHLCFLHASAFGEPHRPTLESCAALEWACQDDIAGLVERRSHALVTDLADPSIDTSLGSVRNAPQSPSTI